MKKSKYLLADSWQQYLDWCYVFSHHPSEYVFIRTKDQIRKLEKGQSVQLIGLFESHEFYQQLIHHATMYAIEIIKGDMVESYSTPSRPIFNIQFPVRQEDL